jgi:hypothetical protein
MCLLTLSVPTRNFSVSLYQIVSKGTLINLRRRAGLRTKERFERLALQSTENVQGKVRDFCRKIQGKLVGMQVSDPATRTTYRERYSVETAQDHLRAGHGVVVLAQIASLTEVDADGPSPRETKRSSGTASGAGIPRQFKPCHGPGFSKRWLWSQLVLNLIASGYPEDQAIYLSLEELIDIARNPAAVYCVAELSGTITAIEGTT